MRQGQLDYAEFLKSPAWREIRRKRLAVDSFRCQSCGSGENLDVHHLKYRKWGTERAEDLLTLCRACHYAEHGKGSRMDFAQKPLNLTFEGKKVIGWKFNGENRWYIVGTAKNLSVPNAVNQAYFMSDEGYLVEKIGQKKVTDDEGLRYLIEKSRDHRLARRFREFLASEGFPQFEEQEETAGAEVAVSPFNFKGQRVQVFLIEGQPWVARHDSCKILGIENASDATSGFPPSCLGTTEGWTETGRRAQIVIISEAGFYRLLRKSRKPEADAFWDWVTDEVLPALRKDGVYRTTPSAEVARPAGAELDDDLRVISGMVGAIQETRNDLRRQGEILVSHEERILGAEARIEQLAIPAHSAASLTGEALAEKTGFGAGKKGTRKLYIFLRANGVLRYRNGTDGEQEFTEAYAHWGKMMPAPAGNGYIEVMAPRFYPETADRIREMLAGGFSAAA